MIVKLVNNGTVPFKGRHNSIDYTLPPGGEQHVPIEAAVLWVGDPTLRDIDDKNKNRSDEVARLMFRYGCASDLDRFMVEQPQLALYTQDGEKVTTVLEDPFGQEVADTANFSVIPDGDAGAGLRAEKMLGDLLSGLKARGVDVEDILARPILDEPTNPDPNIGDVTGKAANTTPDAGLVQAKSASRPFAPSMSGPPIDGGAEPAA